MQNVITANLALCSIPVAFCESTYSALLNKIRQVSTGLKVVPMQVTKMQHFATSRELSLASRDDQSFAVFTPQRHRSYTIQCVTSHLSIAADIGEALLNEIEGVPVRRQRRYPTDR